jgi:hypothetical protein
VVDAEEGMPNLCERDDNEVRLGNCKRSMALADSAGSGEALGSCRASRDKDWQKDVSMVLVLWTGEESSRVSHRSKYRRSGCRRGIPLC